MHSHNTQLGLGHKDMTHGNIMKLSFIVIKFNLELHFEFKQV